LRNTFSAKGAGGPPVAVGCSSSRFSRRSVPSRMKDEAFLYLVYGASSFSKSNVAWAMRKVTTRGFRVIRSSRSRAAMTRVPGQPNRLCYLLGGGHDGEAGP